MPLYHMYYGLQGTQGIVGNSRDQSHIFSFYLPFLGFLRWVRLYLCSQESFANDVSTGCISYFCILGEYGHRIPFLLLCLF